MVVTRIRFTLALAVLAACEHTEPFRPDDVGADGPLNPGSPAQVTFSPGQDLIPAWLPDGSAFVVDFSEEPPIVTDGPYGETHELFNGFWIVQVASKEEAAEWASRCPLGPGSKLEVRRVTEAADFAEFSDNEYIQKEKGWRAEQAENAGD